MKSKIRKIYYFSDRMVRANYCRLFNEKESLISFMFHGNVLFQKDMNNDLVLPQENISLDQFKQFVEFYLEREYSFISPKEIIDGVKEGGKHVLISFDDGYYSNVNVLSILKEFNIPALFCVTANNVAHSKGFWWDVVYRGLKARNIGLEKIYTEIEHLKTQKNAQIEDYLRKNFGGAAQKPISDLDRPFSPRELKEFSEESQVFIGNHTVNHAILPYYSDEEIKLEILNSQTLLQEFTGILPNSIAYPNGGFSQRILEITRNCGLKLGLTVFPKKNKHISQLNPTDLLRINRFRLLGGKNLKDQLELFRSDFQPEGEILELLFKLKYK